jgi:PLP dependent protein
VEALLEAAARTEGKVRARGFMTLAPLVEDPEDVRYVFAKLRAIRDRLRPAWGIHFDLSELSMGMSNDYAVAVEEGATLVRIGRTVIEEEGP